LKGLALGFVAIGVFWRLLHYFLQFPIWGDEAFVCLNFPNQDYLGLTGQLRHAQVAPILFLWGEMTAFRLLGASELAMRLLPLVAGLCGLVLFWRLARVTLAPLAFTLALGIFATARIPVMMCSFVKPYSCDLLMSLALLVPALQWLARPERLRWLLVLALVVPAALLGSYPAVFVAGGVSLGLLPTVWRQPGWQARALYAAYNLLLVGSFAVGCLFVGGAQLDRSGGTVQVYLQTYWANAFPPFEPLAFLRWLALIHTGRMMAYPIGESSGASTLTFLLFLAGVWHFWKSGRRSLVVMLLTPFALGILAAALRRYPYGGCWRISQHMAPIICLLAGAGAGALIERCRTAAARWRWVLGASALLVLVAAGGMAFDVIKPYRSQADQWTRQVVREVFNRAAPEDQIVVLNAPYEVKPMFEWHLAQPAKQIAWNGQLDRERLDKGTGHVWCLQIRRPIFRSTRAQLDPEASALLDKKQSADLERFRAQLAASKRPWILAAHLPYTVIPTDGNGPIERCDLYKWTCPTTDKRPAERDLMSCWP
jgi:hypothetical protein